MSQSSESLNNIYTLSKLFTCEEIKLSALNCSSGQDLLVLYIEGGNFIYYCFTDEEPVIKQIPWFNDPIHTPVSIDFSSSGSFLLVLSKCCHLYILPVLSVLDSTAKNLLCLDTSDLTIHTYPFSSKLPKSKSKSKSLNSSLSVQSSSSNSSLNDKQRSSNSSSSSFSDSQGNDNVVKLKDSQATKCEVVASAVCWWQSIYNSQDVGIIGTESGDIIFVDLISGFKIGETFIKGEIKYLSLCHDKSSESLFLLITASNNDQYKLLLEQQSPAYLWSGKQNQNINDDVDSVDSPNFNNGNYLPSARARLQGLKQMSAEKLESLKHKIAETRSKITKHKTCTKQGLSKDISVKLCGPPPENLNSIIGDTVISPQCCNEGNVLVGYYSQSQFLTVRSMNLDVTPLFIHKMPVETEEVLLGDHVIFVLSNKRTVLQVISTKLTEAWLDQFNDFNSDAILGKWDFRELSKARESEEKLTKDQITALAKPDLIPEDLPYEHSEKIINMYKIKGKIIDFDISTIYKLEKTKEELPNFPKPETCLLVTNKSVYVVELNFNVFKMALDLILEEHELKKAERLCTIYGINLQKLLEFAGDIKLAALEFPTAIALYKLSKCGLLKSIIKLACGNHCSQVLNYSTALMANSISDMSLTERIHLSNLMLMAYTQQILKCENNRNIMDKFIEFLEKNSYFDEVLAVSVTGQSLLFPCLYTLITHRGLILDGYNVLIKLMDRFKSSKVLEWSLNKSEFWKCATESNLTEAMVIKSASFPIYADYVSQHLDELEPEYLNRLLKVLDPTAPAVRPVARSFKKENSFDNDDTQSVFPFGKLIELFLLTLLVKLHKVETGEEDYEREFILPLSENTDGEENLFLINEDSFGSGDTSGEEIWPIRKDIQGDLDKFKKRLETTLNCGYGHTSLVRNGSVYTWGQTAKGCLGHGPTMSRYSSPLPVSWLTNFKLEVSVVSCGKFHTAVLTNNGVYTWGCSQYGQLGLGEVRESPHPRLVTGLADENVITVKCGMFHTLALTNQGSVFAWGWGVHGQLGLGSIDNQRQPKYIDTLKEHFIVDLAAGHGHSLVLSDKGHIYAFGSSVFGQLGTGNTQKSSVPVLVKGINGKVVSIATGYFHNLALTESNTLYSWGSSPQCLRFQAQARKRSRLLQNQNTSLSTDDDSFKSEPKSDENQEQTSEGTGLLDKTESEMHLSPSVVDTGNVSGKIIQISCGCLHSALVTDSGGIYTWGRSIDGQLGNGDHREVQIPTQINTNGFKGNCISCGCEFTAAEEKLTGKIYCWGSNAVGQLAIPIKDSATKSLDGKSVLLKSCKRIVRLLYKGGGSNSVDTPREIPEIPSPTFSYRTLSNYVTSSSRRILQFDPEYSIRTLHFVIEKFTNFINLPFIFKKSLEYGNFQAASKISLLQNKCKQSLVYQLKALQSLPKYHLKSGSYLENQGGIKSVKDNKVEASEIHLFTVEGGREDLCDESRSEKVSVLMIDNLAEERCGEPSNASTLEDGLINQLKSEYMDHAKHILEVYLNLISNQHCEDFDNCFILETGIQFWTAEKLPMASLENFFREKLNEIHYDFGYLMFCTQQRDEDASILEQFSSSFLLEVTSKILSRVEKNESCVEYLETMSKILTSDEPLEKTSLVQKKRQLKKKKPKSEVYLEEIRDRLQHQRLCDNFIKISYGDVVEENVYFFSCGHHHSLRSFQEDCKVFSEITDEIVASKLMSFYSLLDSKNQGDMACPSCVRDYLRQ